MQAAKVATARANRVTLVLAGERTLRVTMNDTIVLSKCGSLIDVRMEVALVAAQMP